jgi:hypothetical protein
MPEILVAQPPITFDVEPFLDAKVRFLRCAPEAEGGPDRGLLNLALNIRNSSAEDVAVTHVRVKVVGSSTAEKGMQQFAWIGRRNTGWYPLPASHFQHSERRLQPAAESLCARLQRSRRGHPAARSSRQPRGRVPLLGCRR